MADRTVPTDYDIAVLGAGPAGIGAALAAREAGARVLVIDEASQAGGQVYRALPDGLDGAAGKSAAEAVEGDRLRGLLADSGAEPAFDHRVWLVTGGLDGGFRIDAVGPTGARSWRVGRLIAATGTHERVVPFPGWTLPGVVGLAATTILLKSQRMAPGQRVLVAGCGPLLAYVAHGLGKLGAEVAGVVDLASPLDWLGALPAMAFARPDLALRGAGWVGRLAARRTPYHPRHHVLSAEAAGTGQGLRIALGRVDRSGRPVGGALRTVEADALAIGHGLVPGTELTRLLRAEHVWQPQLGGWVARRDAGMRTSVPGLYLAGDGGGISGAAAAVHQGRIAGWSAASDSGIGNATVLAARSSAERRSLRRAERFGSAMARMMAPRPALYSAVPASTPVCRCEDVTRTEVEAACAAGASEVNQVKQWTRCGMGPCQGRFCAEAVGEIVAAAIGGNRRAAGLWTGRAPLRPVPLGDLAGNFDYADIPIPKPAPL